MNSEYFNVLSKSIYISRLVNQKKITIEGLAGGGIEVKNLVQPNHPHIKSFVLDISVEDDIVFSLGDGNSYRISIEDSFGVVYGAKNISERLDDLAKFISEIYSDNLKIEIKRSIFGVTYRVRSLNHTYKVNVTNQII